MINICKKAIPWKSPFFFELQLFKDHMMTSQLSWWIWWISDTFCVIYCWKDNLLAIHFWLMSQGYRASNMMLTSWHVHFFCWYIDELREFRKCKSGISYQIKSQVNVICIRNLTGHQRVKKRRYIHNLSSRWWSCPISIWPTNVGPNVLVAQNHHIWKLKKKKRKKWYAKKQIQKIGCFFFVQPFVKEVYITFHFIFLLHSSLHLHNTVHFKIFFLQRQCFMQLLLQLHLMSSTNWFYFLFT